MKSLAGALREGIFGLPLREVEGETRGFRAGVPVPRARMDRIAKCVVHAYNLGLETGDPERLTFLLDLIEPEMRGFAYEGGAMGLAAADLWGLRKDRLQTFAEGQGVNHAYMSYIGAGLALGIFRRDPHAYMKKLDPFTCWLVLNGFGFCHGFFYTKKAVLKQIVPSNITGEALRAYDAGIGRALWFVEAGQPEALKETVSRFSEARRASIWSGIGLACAYASGIEEAQIATLRRVSGSYRDSLAQGAIMAAHTRHVAGNSVPHVDLACRVICDMDGMQAHQIAEEQMADLIGRDRVGEQSAWELWLSRLRQNIPAAAPKHNTDPSKRIAEASNRTAAMA